MELGPTGLKFERSSTSSYGAEAYRRTPWPYQPPSILSGVLSLSPLNTQNSLNHSIFSPLAAHQEGFLFTFLDRDGYLFDHRFLEPRP